jgi:uncharacterized protein YcbK (DUF882 family)
VSLPDGRWFKARELACKDGTPYPERWTLRLAVLLDALDTIRDAYGAPIYVVSGYRTPEHNGAVGGAQASQHMLGRAADIRPVRCGPGDIERLRDIVEDLIFRGKLPAVGGVGVYPNRWIHVDTRLKPPGGHIARWSGAKVGDERTA